MKTKRSPLSHETQRPAGGAGLSRQQMLVLLLVSMMGVIALALMVVLLFFDFPVIPHAIAPTQGMPAVLVEEPTQPALPAPIPGEEDEPEPAALPAACAEINAGLQPANSARVIDPQTLEVMVDGAPLRVRYAGVEPDPNSMAAQVWLASLLQDQPVLLVADPAGQDRDGSAARYVFAGGRFINDELLRQGFARTLAADAGLSCGVQFQQSEQMARVDRVGIWAPTRVPTATFIPFVTLAPREQACDCSIRYECTDFSTRAAAQACYNACNDYNSKLDSDRDGIACEALP